MIEAVEVTKESQAKPQSKRDQDMKQIAITKMQPLIRTELNPFLNPLTEVGRIERRSDQEQSLLEPSINDKHEPARLYTPTRPMN